MLNLFIAFILFGALGYAYLLVIAVITLFILSILNVFTKPILKLDVLDIDNGVSTTLFFLLFLPICGFCAYMLWQNQSIFTPVSIIVVILAVYIKDKIFFNIQF